MEYARKKGVRGFVAEVLAENSKMVALAKHACDKVSVHREGRSLEITMLFD